jgi:hypothetical protein
MKASLSIDHRVSDGALAGFLENPVRMLAHIKTSEVKTSEVFIYFTLNAVPVL